MREGLPPTLFTARSIYDLVPETDGADLVVACEVLEHLEDPRAALKVLQKISQNHIILSVPREPLWRLLNMARGKYLAAWGNTPGHIQHWSRKDFIRLVSCWFEVLEVKSPTPWTMLFCSTRKP